MDTGPGLPVRQRCSGLLGRGVAPGWCGDGPATLGPAGPVGGLLGELVRRFALRRRLCGHASGGLRTSLV